MVERWRQWTSIAPLLAWGFVLLALIITPMAFIGGLLGRFLSVAVVVLVLTRTLGLRGTGLV